MAEYDGMFKSVHTLWAQDSESEANKQQQYCTSHLEHILTQWESIHKA